MPFPAPNEVRHLLHSSFYAVGRVNYQTEKILPTGQVPLLFTLDNPHRLGKSPRAQDNPVFAEAWVDGFQTTPTWHTPEDGTHVMGLLFEPIGFHALFGIDMAQHADRTHDARDVLPITFMDFLLDRLPRAADRETHREIAQYTENLPLNDLPPWLWAFYREIIEQRGQVDLGQWYGRTGRSDRHVTRHFKRAIGVTPKVLCRIHRLIALLEAIDPTTQVNWTELAHEFGFYDQPHFNREFRSLSGLFPSEYLDQRRREYRDMTKGEHVAFAPQP